MNEKREIDPPRDNAPVFAQPASGPGDFNFGRSGPRLVSAAMLDRTRVRNLYDETAGTINDIIIDLELGCFAYAVMASGGFMGVGERLFALDWNSLTLKTERQCYVLDVDKGAFEDEPGGERRGWPEPPFGHNEA
jgi:hypothetical protein